MNTDFKKFLAEVSDVASKYYGSRLNRIILYGSYARGEQREDSDVDLMIVLNDSEVDAASELFRFGKIIYKTG